MNTEIFEKLIGRIGLCSDRKEEIIQLNRNVKAFTDEDKKSIELVRAIFKGNSMFHFRNPSHNATDYILHKLISDRELFEKMKDRGTSVIRLFSLLSRYDDHFHYWIRVGLRPDKCGISWYCEASHDFNIVPLEYSILTNPCFYLKCTVFNDDSPVRNRLARDLTEDKTKLDTFINGILAIKSSDLVISCINTIGAFNEEARSFVNHLQKSNRIDYLLNKNDTTLAKLALKELLKLSILQERKSTKLESPQASSVNISEAQHYSII